MEEVCTCVRLWVLSRNSPRHVCEGAQNRRLLEKQASERPSKHRLLEKSGWGTCSSDLVSTSPLKALIALHCVIPKTPTRSFYRCTT